MNFHSLQRWLSGRAVFAAGAFFAFVAGPWVLSGQGTEDGDEPDAAPLPGHSYHGESFNEGPRQQAYLSGRTGKVSFPVAVSSPEAQAFFDQGVGQLHGFWYFEAERSFRQVLRMDPQCAMAYWGMAMANVNNEKRAAQLIGKAEEALEGGALSERERMWIRSLAAYHRDGQGARKQRARQLVRDLEGMAVEYPGDLEILAFLVFQIWKNESAGLPISSHLSVDALLDRILEANPEHPAHHYRIHLWDNEKPERALASAARCGQSAPGIAHMWHMPGHTYSKLHRYQDAAWQQEASARVDHAHMMRDRVLPDQIHNYAHNNGWLVENLGYVGRVEEGIAISVNLVELPRLARLSELGGLRYSSGGSSYSEGRRRLFDLLVDYQLWDRLLALCDTRWLEPTDDPREQTNRLMHMGLAKVWKEDLTGARAALEGLGTVVQDLRERRESATEAAAAKARDEGKEGKEIEEAEKNAGKPFDEFLGSMEKHRRQLETYLAVFEKPAREAREALDECKDIPAVERARLFARLANYEKAEEILVQEVESGRNPLVARSNHALMLQALDRKEELKAEMETLRTLASAADLEAPPLKALDSIAQECGFPKDWRVSREVLEDTGKRPELDSLGPFRWEPVEAPQWRLPRADAPALALEDYRGRNVLALFFLGRGCVHCLEQLQAFAPVHQAYADAGIEIVAVSTDGIGGLPQTLLSAEGQEGSGPYPFPLVSDAELEAFRAYRAFDEFEETPMHGAFFIDGQGLIRWQDIGYEPFMEAEWLLGECRRLLDLSGTKEAVAAVPEPQ
ncbi:MAG TPA: redoxin domain-containing protein [Verrucomicrobiales bacterium]|nr:redoxin domain-containing protein [Verrucomicrobiales bacterium]